MKDFNKYIIIYLHVLLATNFLLTCMEEMEGTPVFRQKLKQSANRFKEELMKATEADTNQVWGCDDEAMYNLMEHQENLLKEIANMRPENCGIILKMIERYKVSPEAIKNWLGVKIIEREEACS